MVGKIGKCAGDCFAAVEVFRLEICPIGGENELCLRRGRLRALAQRLQRLIDGPGVTGGDVNVAALKHTAWQIGRVRSAAAQLLERCGFVSKGFEERERELRSIKGMFS